MDWTDFFSGLTQLGTTVSNSVFQGIKLTSAPTLLAPGQYINAGGTIVTSPALQSAGLSSLTGSPSLLILLALGVVLVIVLLK
jgi:hypothetical protein